MTRLIFLVEEYSMKILLDGILPRLFPGLPFLAVPHEGKADLEKSIPRKLRAWRVPGDRFVVVRDNDGGDCLALKGRLVELCTEAGRSDTLARIPCQEMEAWYFGEPEALVEAFQQPDLADLAERARFRESDTIMEPSAALKQLVPEFQKVSGARRLAPYLTEERNRSRSFHCFIEGVRRIVGEA